MKLVQELEERDGFQGAVHNDAHGPFGIVAAEENGGVFEEIAPYMGRRQQKVAP